MDNYIELKNICKYFPVVIALKNMSFNIKSGEIHGLIGENGAGKSVLIRILTGIYIPDSGNIYIDGKLCNLKSPKDSIKNRIACVYRELNIVPQLNVIDNIFLGHEYPRKKLLIDYKKSCEIVKNALIRLGCDHINIFDEVSTMGIGQQQMIEIARAISFDAKILILDEPTSSLGKDEAKNLLMLLKKLKSQGITIILVSHKLEELYEVCDSVTVIRDGQHILTDDIKNVSNDW